MTFYISPPPGNRLAGVLTGIIGLLLMAGAFMLGLFALVIALGVGLVAWMVVYARLWWSRRKRPGGGPGTAYGTRKGEDIEVEYTVISRRRED